ncbi:hypothetical protein EG68_09790 [Paragonimus skrjabini miyazakii]|uniref:Uncharacterized protein n=1 Tax=Paragonimus skrjabini miyazakii TaxID=59628 RepID=A0A8S9YL31_9TREM|nr:hypothetical protein EG68_09790 [Paragonimus skrjabini miyazakii]
MVINYVTFNSRWSCENKNDGSCNHLSEIKGSPILIRVSYHSQPDFYPSDYCVYHWRRGTGNLRLSINYVYIWRSAAVGQLRQPNFVLVRSTLTDYTLLLVYVKQPFNFQVVIRISSVYCLLIMLLSKRLRRTNYQNGLSTRSHVFCHFQVPWHFNPENCHRHENVHEGPPSYLQTLLQKEPK